MNVKTILTPAEIALLPLEDLTATTVVVFDVLRATSTMTTALENGVSAIYPAANIEEARALKKVHPEALLGGERHGEKIAGFDLGNSPLEYGNLAGREIISTTTNGTVALRAVAHAQTVIAGSLLNVRVTAEMLTKSTPTDLLLICAGTGKHFAIEDGLAVGALLNRLRLLVPESIAVDDSTIAMEHLWNANAHQVFTVLEKSKNGHRLIERNRRAEVEWCAKLDACSAVGVLNSGALQKLPHS